MVQQDGTAAAQVGDGSSDGLSRLAKPAYQYRLTDWLHHWRIPKSIQHSESNQSHTPKLHLPGTALISSFI